MGPVLLVQPPVEDFYLTRKRTIPYGLASIASALAKDGFTARVIDGLATPKSRPVPTPAEFGYLAPYYGRPDMSLFSLFHDFRHYGYSFEHIGATARDSKPFLVGISSLFTPYWDTAEKTAKAVKRFLPDVPLVMGGHHPTRFPEKVLASAHVDFVLRGEGEQSLPMLCRALRNKTGLDRVPGLAYLKKGKAIVSDPHWIKDLGGLPIPDLAPSDPPYYARNGKRSVTIVASRGCPMPCTYCAVSSTSDHGRFRRRPVNAIVREIQAHARKQDIGFIDFEDENLSLDKGWFLELLDGLRRLFPDKGVELRAMNGLFPPSLDGDIIAAMAGAGFKTLNLSLGSVSGEQLRRFRRPDVRSAHDNALDLARENGLSAVSYIIAAAPGQTPESSVQDLVFLARRPTLAGLSVFYPAPGSRDYVFCRENRLLPSQFSLMRSSALPLDHTTSRRQSVTLLRLARILNYMKGQIDRHSALPGPAPFDPYARLSGFDRETASRKLFQWFLDDGRIRGIDRRGEVYDHTIDTNLTKAFIRAIQGIGLMGTEKGPVRLAG